MSATHKIYLAGPDVFRPNAETLAKEAKALCAGRGHIGLSPVDSPAKSSKTIFLGNIDLLNEATVVIANLNPFRGAEVDTGTAFEVGMAVALGKRVIGYIGRQEEMKDRVVRCFSPVFTKGDCLCDTQDDLVENFGNPVNLMIAESCEIVVGGLAEAIDQLEKDTTSISAKGFLACSQEKTAISELARYFTSGNDVPVDRATIRAEDFWRIVGKTQ